MVFALTPGESPMMPWPEASQAPAISQAAGGRESPTSELVVVTAA